MTLSELFDKADEMVAKRYPDCNASIKEMNSYRDGYIHGMIEKLEGMIPIEKACQWIESYLFDIGFPDDWCRDSATMKSGKQRFLEAMEE